MAKTKRVKIRSGKRADLNGVFFRSGWESNVARIFNHLNIKWEYETETFVFTGLTRGKVAYQPDFLITNKPRRKAYADLKGIRIEVKGRMNPGDYTKLLNFKRQYPEEFSMLRGIVRKNTKAHKAFNRLKIPILWFYDDLTKEYSEIIEGWE